MFFGKITNQRPHWVQAKKHRFGNVWVHKLTKVSASRAQMKTFLLTRRDLPRYGPQKIGWTSRNGNPTKICSFWVFWICQKITFGPIWVGTQKGSRLDPNGPKGSPIGPKGSPMGPKGPFGGRRPTKGALGPYWGP